MPRRSDDELRVLMSRYQGGDHDAFREIYSMTAIPIQRYLGRWSDPARAGDLTQDTFLQIHRARRTYRPELPVLPRMFAIARHVEFQSLRWSGADAQALLHQLSIAIHTGRGAPGARSRSVPPAFPEEVIGAISMRRVALVLVLLFFAIIQTSSVFAAPAPPSPRRAAATFAGGCFWCEEKVFDGVPGVIEAVSGYTGGHLKNPTYEQVSAGGTGHAEAVQVTYDPTKISYEKLLDLFWHNVDPLTANAQFCDVGSQYRSAIFYHDAEQKRLAEASKGTIEASHRFNKPIVTQIVPGSTFYRAEKYHQNYAEKNPVRYRFYTFNCGRERRLRELWGSAGR